jgi:hypothetical protein
MFAQIAVEASPRTPSRRLPARHPGLVLRAVHDDVRPADPARARREQERRHVGDLLGRAEPPERELLAHPALERLGVVPAAMVPAAALEQDRAGADRVDADAVRAELAAERGGEVDLGRLRRGVLRARLRAQPAAGGRRPEIEAMKTIAPPPAARMSGTAARATTAACTTLSSNVVRQS